MLEVEGLGKAYKKKIVLSNVSFSAEPGEIIGLVGENGAGKSTLLNMIATLDKPTSGTIRLNGFDSIGSRKQYRKLIGYVPQDLAIWDSLSVEENMLFFEKLSWVRKEEDALQEICRNLALDHWKEMAGTLSGGQKRKLNLAISLIHEPDLLLLDEPTVGIDMRSKSEIVHYLKQLAIQKNKAILYISHDMDEIKTLCDRLICIGKDPFYRELLQSANQPMLTF
ncbi:ABC transporter ATP-binding protein [Aciduricibacillus chroicocephali]|uniref:ABC transporter ATP-binding protein n=1 Tax=Aciduricibacillus chroicocephali TaxID=3054939 RepID=A0ABY9KSH9_9BACI|nr:ABC transporter ATP-binding protein [Bacillaceae bacterium 44XB]